MTASSGTPRPKSDILSSVLERARTAGAWRRAGAPMNWLWRAEQREGWRRAMDAAEGAETWNAEADAAMDTARMIAVLHIISARGWGISAALSALACTSHFSCRLARGQEGGNRMQRDGAWTEALCHTGITAPRSAGMCGHDLVPRSPLVHRRTYRMVGRHLNLRLVVEAKRNSSNIYPIVAVFQYDRQKSEDPAGNLSAE